MASKKSHSRGMSAPSEDSETNVQVILRCRPPSQDELASRAPQVIKCDESSGAVTLTQTMSSKQYGRTYHFDQVFGPETTQEQLYEESISPIVEEVLNGFNCTIFAYGQTGTGKTHTMTGELATVDNSSEKLPGGSGVIPRAVADIFQHLEDNASSTEYTVKCCFLELYNEEITDLLAMGSEVLKIRILEDRSGVVVQGLEEPHVKGAADIFALLETGNARRRTAETLLNKQSSRSHSVFIVTVSVREVLAEGEEVIRVGKLYLVDLAGSENVSRSGAVDQRAKEAGNINKSLLTLGRVITALVEGQGHVPYRDSKLTRLLRDSLGGRTKTCIIATIAPTVQCQEETMSTLDYAHRAKNIKNKPEINQKISKTTHLKELSGEIARLKAELLAQREKNGVYLPASQYEEECAEREHLAARAEELEQEMAKVDERIRAVHSELQEARDGIAQRDFMLRAYEKAERSLSKHAYVVTDELKAAASDVTELFVRLDAKNELEDANVAVVNELRSESCQKINALEIALQNAANDQSKKLRSATDVLEKLLDGKTEVFRTVCNQIETLQTNIDGMRTTVDNALSALKAENSSCIEACKISQTEFLDKMRITAEEAANELNSAHQALLASTSEEKEALAAVVSGHQAASNVLREAMNVLIGSIQTKLGKAQSDAQMVSSSIRDVFQTQATAAEQHAARFADFARQERAQLLQQVQDLIGGFMERSEKHVSHAMQSIKATCVKDQDMLASSVDGLATDVARSLQELEAHGGEVQNAEASMQKTVRDAFEKLNHAIESTGERATALQCTASRNADEALESIAKFSNAAISQLKKDLKAFQSESNKRAKACAAACDAPSKSLMETHKMLETRHEDELASLSAAQVDMKSTTELISMLRSNQSHGLQVLGNAIQNSLENSFRIDTERGMVPEKREYLPASHDDVDRLRAPSHDALVARFQSRDQSSAEETTSGRSDQENVARPDPQEIISREAQGVEDDKTHVAQVKVASDKILSPSVVGQKRSRSEDGNDDMCASPSKLRAAFRRGERRRAQRSVSRATD